MSEQELREVAKKDINRSIKLFSGMPKSQQLVDELAGILNQLDQGGKSMEEIKKYIEERIEQIRKNEGKESPREKELQRLKDMFFSDSAESSN